MELLVFNKWISKRRKEKKKTSGSAMMGLLKSTANRHRMDCGALLHLHRKEVAYQERMQ